MTVVSYVQTERKVAALTFDDGPSRADTSDLLAVLDEAKVHCTFFVRGEAVDSSTQDLVLRAAHSGHEIANHTRSHLRELGERERSLVATEILHTHDRLRQLTGIEPALVRPPYGHCLDEFDLVAADLGYGATIHWSVIPEDYRNPGAREIAKRVLAQLHEGAIVLLHDGSPDGTESREQTVQAVRIILPALHALGFELLTVSELLDCGSAQRIA